MTNGPPSLLTRSVGAPVGDQFFGHGACRWGVLADDRLRADDGFAEAFQNQRSSYLADHNLPTFFDVQLLSQRVREQHGAIRCDWNVITFHWCSAGKRGRSALCHTSGYTSAR